MHVRRRTDRDLGVASQIVDESTFSGASEPHDKNIELLMPHIHVCGTHRWLQNVTFRHIAWCRETVRAEYLFALALVSGSPPFLSPKDQRARSRLVNVYTCFAALARSKAGQSHTS